ncbi:unnamed protein product [Notodromas monacha]|uniref:Uncharacterized protein n=1 Tax=Notodromas monacha TaxID=399045 RepID=A0A7R9GDA2_9CRUS|nr:unnamed protein product [Notodromas monacha]CAG0918339.1 unnamed protein product [Notodromas monacha]
MKIDSRCRQCIGIEINPCPVGTDFRANSGCVDAAFQSGLSLRHAAAAGRRVGTHQQSCQHAVQKLREIPGFADGNIAGTRERRRRSDEGIDAHLNGVWAPAMDHGTTAITLPNLRRFLTESPAQDSDRQSLRAGVLGSQNNRAYGICENCHRCQHLDQGHVMHKPSGARVALMHHDCIRVTHCAAVSMTLADMSDPPHLALSSGVVKYAIHGTVVLSLTSPP